jgi:hypothetical protein
VAIIMGAATVPASTTGTLLFVVPPSYCNVTFYNLGTLSSQTCWLGTSANVTSANGLQCHSIPTSFNTYMGSKGCSIYGAVAGTASTYATTLQYIISTDF